MTVYINFGKKKDIPMDDLDNIDGIPGLTNFIRSDFVIDKSSEEWVTCPEYPEGIPQWLGDEENIMKLRHQTNYYSTSSYKLPNVECMDCCASEWLIPRPVARPEVIWCLKNETHLGPLPEPPVPDWICPDELQDLSTRVPRKGRPEGLTDQEYVLDYLGLIKPKVRAGELTGQDRAFLSYGNFQQYSPCGSAEPDPAYRSYKVADYDRNEEEVAAFIEAEAAREAAKPKPKVKELIFSADDYWSSHAG